MRSGNHGAASNRSTEGDYAMTQTTLLFFRRTIRVLIAITFGLSAATGASIDNPVLYTEDRSGGATIQDRDPMYVPTYLVYADKALSEDEARILIGDLGMTKHLEEYKARAYVIGPVNGAAYDSRDDFAAFQNLLRTRRA